MGNFFYQLRSWLTRIYDNRYRGTVLGLKLARLWPRNDKGSPPAPTLTAEEAAQAYKEGRLGYVIIQIDGLSYDVMQDAVRKGFMPHLKRLLKRGDHGQQTWYPGLPSDTPGIQMGLMYGDNRDILGFYWRDREANCPISCANPTHVQKLEQAIASERRGILEGGSSYANVVSGGANRAVLTMSDLRPRSPGFVKALLKWSTLFLSNPIQLAILPFLIIWEFAQEVLDRILVEVQRRPHLKTEGWFPIARLFMNLLCREIVTMGVQLDMMSGVPIIYCNYPGYDLVGHHSGPRSINAMLVLRGIDHQIRQIDGLLHAGQRHYMLFVLSDHGMNPSLPFQETYHHSLQDYVRQVFQNSDREEECCTEETTVWDRMIATLARKLRRGQRLLEAEAGANQAAIHAVASSPLAHIYLDHHEKGLLLEEIEERYPHAVQKLLQHPGIGTVIARTKDGIAILVKRGRVLLDADGEILEIVGQNPLDQFDHEDKARNQIVRLVGMVNCGDLVLFGAYDKLSGVCVSFESQLSAHASLGGEQMHSFIVYPLALPQPPEDTWSSCDMYPYFASLVGIEQQASSTSGIAPDLPAEPEHEVLARIA